jgi:hypothetical protein
MIGESGYERVENDAYYTPAWCTEALLRNVEFIGKIWEPAAGTLAMVNVLSTKYDVLATDIAYEDSYDFLSPGMCDAFYDNIVTNPPYSLATQFIERALFYSQRKVAMLLRNEFDCAKSRQHLFGNCPQFAMKLVLTKRPKWFDDDKASPRHNFSWFIWDWDNNSAPIIKYDQ